MQRIIVEDSIASKFATSTEGIELCDASGRMLGYFIPAITPTPEEYEAANAQWTDEELDRRAAEPGAKSTDEVLKRLSEL